MLPILRVIPVGGVLLAIAILLLALNPPGDPRGHLTGAGGALIAREQHPEWPQFLLLAAARRAVELNRLRELPDTTMRSVPPPAPPQAEQPPAVAAVPASRNDADPEDVTGTIVQSPGARDSGRHRRNLVDRVAGDPARREAAGDHDARARQGPSVRARPCPPPRASAANKPVRRARRAKSPAEQQASAQFNFFEALFGGSGKPAGRRPAPCRAAPAPAQ